MSIKEVILPFMRAYFEAHQQQQELLQPLSFPYDQLSAQPMIRYMDHNGCSAKIQCCDLCSTIVLTGDFDSISAQVTVHATMNFDMLVQGYLVLGSLAASLALRTHIAR